MTVTQQNYLDLHADMQNLLMVNKSIGKSLFANIAGSKPPQSIEARIMSFLIPHSFENNFFFYVMISHTEKIVEKFALSHNVNILTHGLEQNSEKKKNIDKTILFFNAINIQIMILYPVLSWRPCTPTLSYEAYQLFHKHKNLNTSPLGDLIEYHGHLITSTQAIPDRSNIYQSIFNFNAHRLGIDCLVGYSTEAGKLNNILETWKATNPTKKIILNTVINQMNPTSGKVAYLFSVILGGMLLLNPLSFLWQYCTLCLRKDADGKPLANFEISLLCASAMIVQAVVEVVLLVSYVSTPVTLLFDIPPLLKPQRLTLTDILIMSVAIKSVIFFINTYFDPNWNNQSYLSRINRVVHLMIKPVQNTWKNASIIWNERNKTLKWLSHTPQLIRDFRAASRYKKEYAQWIDSPRP